MKMVFPDSGYYESKIVEPTISKAKNQILKPFVKTIAFWYVSVQALLLKARNTDI